MFLNGRGTPAYTRCEAKMIFMAFLLTCCDPRLTFCDTSTGCSRDEIARRFTEITLLKSEREWDAAIEQANEIIEMCSDADDALKKAYIQLVDIYDQKKEPENARRIAAEALERFPTIEVASDFYFPPALDSLYFNPLRQEMFGRFTITRPEGCRLFLNGKFVGTTPFDSALVRFGTYELVLTKSGYRDYADTVAFQKDLERSDKLDRVRGPGERRFLAALAAIGTTAVALLIHALTNEEAPAPEPEPIAPPPPPPSGQ